MEISGNLWTQTPMTDFSVKCRSVAMKLEKAVFLSSITAIAFLAIPPNLLIVYLAIFPDSKRKGGRKNSLERRWNVSLLLISQGVSHVLICLTSPLDVLFLVEDGSDEIECVTFLSVKSVLILFSALTVSLQGLDKVYRVHNLPKPFLTIPVRIKVAAIAFTIVLSSVPLILEIILTTGRPLENGCSVRPIVVDIAAAIFFLGCAISIASLVAVVVMLRRHSRQVTAGNEGGRSKKEMPEGYMSSTRVPSVSELTDFVIPQLNGTQGSRHAAGPLNVAEVVEKKMQITWKPPTTDSALVNTTTVVHIVVSPASRCSSPSANPAPTHLGNSGGGQRTFLSSDQSRTLHTDDHSAVSSTRQQEVVQTLSPVVQTEGPHPVTGPLEPLAVSLPPVAAGKSKRLTQDQVSWSQMELQQPRDWEKEAETAEGRNGNFPRSTSFTSVIGSQSARSNASSSTTLLRLKAATVTAAKQGVLLMAVFLLCYVPLMVILLVLSLDHPVPETALLLEGLTLPISYIHALLSPLLLIRADPEWRVRGAAMLCYWLCCKKGRTE